MQLTQSIGLTAPPPPPDSSILIVGSGTWGASTALCLARRGYINVTVLDPYFYPSVISAGTDINKVLALSSSAPPGSLERYVADTLAEDALRGWKEDPVFDGLYHETGFIIAASSEKGRAALEAGNGHCKQDGWMALTSESQFQNTMPLGILTGKFPGWTGYWKRSGCGWVESRKALKRVIDEATRLGVKFLMGESGRVLSLVYEAGDVRGAVVAYGPPIRADRTILCAGANTSQLFDMEDQLRPTAWTLAYIKMTPEEVRFHTNLPVLYNIERGFFIEPDKETLELKVGDEHPGYCNWETNPDASESKRNSVPFACHQIPLEAETRIRNLLHDTMPYLANRRFSRTQLCWDADTPDRTFLISRHPRYPSLVVGAGGSGLGFSYIPNIGGVIADCLEGRMDPTMEQLFRWRPETAVNRKWTDTQGRFGPPGSTKVMDLQKVNEWRT